MIKSMEIKGDDVHLILESGEVLIVKIDLFRELCAKLPKC